MKKKGVPTFFSPIYNAVTHILKTQHCRWGKGVLIYRFRRILDLLIIYAQDCLKNCKTASIVFLQDGCPLQNSKKAQQVFNRIAAHLFCIPARSPDIDLISPIDSFRKNNTFKVIK